MRVWGEGRARAAAPPQPARLRPPRGHEEVLERPRAAHETPERPDRLAERPHVHVNVMLHPKELRRAAAGGPAGERAVGVVHGQEEAVAAAQGRELPERGEVAWAGAAADVDD